MANLSELSERLRKRFKNVPNVTSEDAVDWTVESMMIHGYDSSSNIPNELIELVLLNAQAEGAFQIALSTAHYFQYTDGEESVNKTAVSDQYRKLAQDIRIQYENEKRRKSGVKVGYMKRVDRP